MEDDCMWVVSRAKSQSTPAFHDDVRAYFEASRLIGDINVTICGPHLSILGIKSSTVLSVNRALPRVKNQLNMYQYVD